jgi:hypothetical protein
MITVFRRVSFSLALYGCETSCLIFREECLLRVLEKRVLRQIFAPKMEDLKGDWRSLPYGWYLPNIVW